MSSHGSMVDAHAHDIALGGAGRPHDEVGVIAQRLPVGRARLVHAVDLTGLHGGHAGILVHTDEGQFVQIGQRIAVFAHAPVVGAAFEASALAFAILFQRESTGADGLLDKVALEVTVQDNRRIVEEMLRHGDIGRGQMQFDGVIVHLLDTVHAVQIGEQAQHGRTNVLVEPLAEGEHHIVGGQFVAVVESHALLQIERPLVHIVVGFPTVQQIGAGDVVGTGFGQIFTHLAHDVRAFDPGEAGGVIDQL